MSKPLITHRLEPGFNLTFMLQDLYPNISLGTEYAMQLHGYMALPNQTSTLQINHAVGQATLHLGHCLFQVSDASENGPAKLSSGSRAILPSLTGSWTFHFQLTFTCESLLSAHNPQLQSDSAEMVRSVTWIITLCCARDWNMRECKQRSSICARSVCAQASEGERSLVSFGRKV